MFTTKTDRTAYLHLLGAAYAFELSQSASCSTLVLPHSHIRSGLVAIISAAFQTKSYKQPFSSCCMCLTESAPDDIAANI